MSNERIEKYAKALGQGIGCCDGVECEECLGGVEAVMAVADAEQAELRAENEALKSWLTDARAAVQNMDRLLTEANSDFARLVEAKVARVEAAIRLLGNGEITPQGARILRAALEAD